MKRCRRVLASVGTEAAVVFFEDQLPVFGHQDRMEILELTGIRNGAESLERRRIQTHLFRSDVDPGSGPGIRT